MKFLFLEPFYGGSHKDFAQGLVSHSKYKIDLITLPARLSYPEIIPKVFHDDFLYKDQTELVEKLCYFIQNYSQFTEKQHHLSVAMERFAWENMIDKYDEMLKNLALK